MKEARLRRQILRVFCHCAQMTQILCTYTHVTYEEDEKRESGRGGVKGSIQSKNKSHLQEFVFMKSISALNEHAQNKEVSNQTEHKCLNERQLFKQFVPTTLVCFQRVAGCSSQQSPNMGTLCTTEEY